MGYSYDYLTTTLRLPYAVPYSCHYLMAYNYSDSTRSPVDTMVVLVSGYRVAISNNLKKGL